ncbi:MAG TPA: phosphoglucomutase/phosphomannomutase family protein [Thermoanaerobaculia bacterium]|nr:phosphoglucomutase/phosphomannomutase family protein [Thermoanaerobaculia bacterium]
MPLPPIVFGTDGWRGRIARDLTFASLGRVVDAAAAWNVSPENTDPGDPWTVPIVHDTRFLSPELAAEAADRLASRGFRVLLTDRPVPTPCASWQVHARGLRGGLAITASHNPAPWNGVKVKSWFGGSATPGTYVAIARHADRELPARPGGAVEKVDLRRAYADAVASRADLDAIRRAGLRVLFDAMHGSAGTLLEEIVGRGHATSVTTLRGERDPLFGGVNPEPIPENLAAAREALRGGPFDLVLASDGDGDRLGVLDARGSFVTPHRVLALLAESLTARGRISGGVAKTFSTSLLVDRVAARLGVPLSVTPVGFKHIAEKMMSGEVAIGGEESGGLGVSFHLPERDGVLTALLVLEAIAHSGGSLAALVAKQDADYGALAYGRRDIHLPMPVLEAFVAGLRAAPPAARAGRSVTGLDDLDGVKLLFGGNGWLLHRLSGTEPIIRIYAEHEDEKVVAALLDETEAGLRRREPESS